MSPFSRLLQNPAIADIYTEHAHTVGAAKYSPSGFYIASGGKGPGHEHIRFFFFFFLITGAIFLSSS